MKKTIIIVFMFLFTVFLSFSKAKVNAETISYNEGVKSPRYNSNYNPPNTIHMGYYYSYEETNDKRTITYSDIYRSNKFRVYYNGNLGSPQIALKSPMMYLEQLSVNKLSFFMSKEYIHTNSLTFKVSIEINDISGGFGITWSKVTRYAEGVKITANVDGNRDSYFVVLSTYRVEATIHEIAHVGVSTKTSTGWSSYKWDTYNASNPMIIGYVGFYGFEGEEGIEDYKTGQYLIDNHRDFGEHLYEAGN